MNLTLEFDEETGRRLKAVAESRGMTTEEYVQWLVKAYLPSQPPEPPKPLDVWLAEWKAWVESHEPLPHEADDDRESIYAGRGE